MRVYLNIIWHQEYMSGKPGDVPHNRPPAILVKAAPAPDMPQPAVLVHTGLLCAPTTTEPL